MNPRNTKSSLRAGAFFAVAAVALVASPLRVDAQQQPASPEAESARHRVDAAERVVGVIDRIRANLRSSTYRHTLHVDERVGLYDFDCSAMASWILARSAPRALATVGGSRPLAVDFYRTIARTPPDRPRGGWQRVARVRDARPGDVIAWQRPRWFRSNNTGHVAFVIGNPMPDERGWLLPIADASSYNHEQDSRAGRTGFGTGIILITADPSTGEATGYGWFGRLSGEWVVPVPVAIGRPTG